MTYCTSFFEQKLKAENAFVFFSKKLKLIFKIKIKKNLAVNYLKLFEHLISALVVYFTNTVLYLLIFFVYLVKIF